MMSGIDQVSTCVGCGAEATGNFCSACGRSLTAGATCGECGARLRAGALYCADCGKLVATRPPKPASARLPWILSATALAIFSVAIALLVQRQTRPRVGDMTLTGGIPGQEAESSDMPSMEELAAMTPREAADRLFERAMREHEAGDFERASFFIDMGIQAYAAVPPDEINADAHFHIGLLRLLMGDSASARARAEAILAEEAEHLLGLLLASRAADFAGDVVMAEELRERVRESVKSSGGIPDRPEYVSHRVLIERALEEESR